MEDPKDLINDLKKGLKKLNNEKFFPNKTALYALVAACFVVCSTMGVRQTFGLYSSEFEISGGSSNTEFGLAIAVHAIFLRSLHQYSEEFLTKSEDISL